VKLSTRVIRAHVAGVATLIALTAGCGGGSGARELSGYTLDPAPQVGDLSLPDAAADGVAMSLRASPGGLLLVFFGYTNCPDVCPLTVSEIRSALGEIDHPESVRVAMVTIDPNRDTPETLTNFVRSFVPNGHALRTTDDTVLRSIADRFGVSYSVTTADDGSVEVAHSGSVFVVDDTGEVRLVWTFGTTAQDMSADMSLLLDHATT
jgi:protein SCO1/2